MKDYTAINLRATTTCLGIEEFEIFDHPDADFSPNVDVFLSIVKSLDEGDEAFYQVLPAGTDGEYERIDSEYGITRLRGDLPTVELYINNENLGSEPYVGTREEFIEAMTPVPLAGWYDEYLDSIEQDRDYPAAEPVSYDEWVKELFDEGLRPATDEEIARFPLINN